MNESSSVIIYRSKFEQQQDEYWSDFMANHPTVIIWVMGFIVGVILFEFFRIGKRFRKF